MSNTFKPETAAIVLIDHQVGTMQLIKNISPDLVLRNAVNLAKAAKELMMPLVLTASMEDNLQGPLAPALERVAPDEYAARVKRLGIVSAWDDPNFKAAVVATGRKQLIMAGVTTDICLVFPAIAAVREGFEVLAVLDASGSPSDLAEEMARHRMEQEGVILTTAATVIAELVHDWASPAGSVLVQLLLAANPPMLAAV
jgi:nicotinamidase-related amidase